MACWEVLIPRFSEEQILHLSNIVNLLTHDNRRKEFRIFLSNREFHDDERTLCSWEMIYRISDAEPIDQIKQKIKDLISFVEVKNVNLDMNHIRDLKECLEDQDVTRIKQRLDTIRGVIVDLLNTTHNVYIVYLSSRH